MANPSPTCTVNGSATPQDVTASSTVTIALVSTAGANFWFLQATATDDLNTAAAINATLSINQVTKTATFTAPAGLGSAVIFTSTVGIGQGSALGAGLDANGVLQTTYTTTFKVNVKASSGLRVIATSESLEQGSAGWIAQINAAIRAVAAATLAVSGSGLVHQTGGATDSTAYKGTAGQFLVTNAAASDTAWATITGDATASATTVGKLTVTGLQNQALPAPSGSNTVLQWSGSALSWANVSAGFASLTGVDVVAADSAHAYVQSISGASGAGGTIPVNATSLQFAAAQIAAGIGQATAGASQTPANLVLTPQAPNGSATSGHQTPGSLVVALANPVGSGSPAGLVVQYAAASAGNTILGGVSVSGTEYAVAWYDQSALSLNNYNFIGQQSIGLTWLHPVSINFFTVPYGGSSYGGSSPTSAGISATSGVGGALTLYSQNQINNPSPGASIDVQDQSITMTVLEVATNQVLFEVGEFSTSRRFTALNAVFSGGAGIASANLPSGDGVTWIGNAKVNPVSAPTGGAILYASGGALFVYQSNGSSFQISPGGGGGTVTGVDVAGVDNAHQYVVSVSGSAGGGGQVPVGTFANPVALKFPNLLGAVMIYGGTESFLLNDGSNNPQINGVGSVQIQTGNTPLAAFNGVSLSRLAPDSSLSSFMLGWYSGTTSAATGANLTLQPQFSTNGNATGGNLQISLEAAAGSGSEAFVTIQRSTLYSGPYTTTLSLGALPGSGTTTGAIFGRGISPSSSNYAFAAGGTFTQVNAPTSGGALSLLVNNSNIISLTASLIAPQIAAFTWAQGVSFPTIGQTGLSSDASTTNLTITAQNAYASAVSNVNGGFLLIGGGESTSPGVTGKRGGVQICMGNPLNTGVPLFQVTEPVIAQRIIALATTSTVSSTDMPANTGDCVVYVRNAATAPTASATNGGILYAQAGALKWRGSSGTVTTMGPADPHCPACGSDYVIEHENPKWGYHAVCMKCLGEQFGEVPWVMTKKAA